MADKPNPYAGLDTSLLKMKRQAGEEPPEEDEKRLDVKTPKRQDVKTPKYERKTLYLTADQVAQLKRLEAQRFERGEKIDQSGLVREAVDLLLKTS